jgi:hypothetical protein
MTRGLALVVFITCIAMAMPASAAKPLSAALEFALAEAPADAPLAVRVVFGTKQATPHALLEVAAAGRGPSAASREGIA